MKNTLMKMTDDELIDVIESPERYTKEIIRLVPIEVERRKIPIEKRIELAKIIFIDKIRKMLGESLYKFEDFEIPASSILSQDQKNEIFESELENFTSRRKSLNHGLGKYIG